MQHEPPGNCYDNAVMEAFFSTVKTELTEHFATPAEAKRELFEYLEVFYNQRRRQSTLDYVSPAAYERQALQQRASPKAASAPCSGGIVQPAPEGDRRSWGIL